MAVAEYHNWGEEIRPEDATDELVRGLLRAIRRHPFCSLSRVLRNGDLEGVEVEVEVGIPRRPAYDICKVERLLIARNSNPSLAHSCLALRRDFPSTPHQNLIRKGTPRSLCLFTELFSEVLTWLTPEQLLGMTSAWLHRAASGTLHQQGQRLEPFFLDSSATVIVEPELIELEGQLPLVVVPASKRLGADVLRARVWEEGRGWSDARYAAFGIPAERADGVVIHHHPENIGDLVDLLRPVGIDLMDKMRKAIAFDGPDSAKHKFFEQKWLILVRIPKYRTDPNVIETTEYVGFLVLDKTIGELGEYFRFCTKQGNQWGQLVNTKPPKNLGIGKVGVIDPVFARSRQLALRLAGLDSADKRSTLNIAAIGVGALGSHVAELLARQGIGMWGVIDVDHLLPHNMFRHAAHPSREAMNKVDAVALEINAILADKDAARGHKPDLSRSDEEPEFRDMLNKAEVILDFSASPAVLRTLANDESKAPRLSTFLTANGEFAIALWEGLSRSANLIDLDVQLAVAATNRSELSDLHKATNPDHVQYGGSCSSVTNRIPPDVIVHHAATISMHVKQSIESEAPSIAVWRLDSETQHVHRHSVEVQEFWVAQEGEYEIRACESALKAIRSQREDALPQETGGVLIGSFDLLRKQIHVGLALPAPPDSRATAEGFERGSEGLVAELERIGRLSGGNLCYVGEWHSHPKEYNKSPSPQDLAAMSILGPQMAEEGLPQLFLIQGDDEPPNVALWCPD